MKTIEERAIEYAPDPFLAAPAPSPQPSNDNSGKGNNNQIHYTGETNDGIHNIDSLLGKIGEKYETLDHVEVTQGDPNERTVTNFKQEYTIIIRKKKRRKTAYLSLLELIMRSIFSRMLTVRQ